MASPLASLYLYLAILVKKKLDANHIWIKVSNKKWKKNHNGPLSL